MTSKIGLLTQELEELERQRAAGGPNWLDGQIAILKRRLKWHLMRARPKKHPNVGTASFCPPGRPSQKKPLPELPLGGLSAGL